MNDYQPEFEPDTDLFPAVDTAGDEIVDFEVPTDFGPLPASAPVPKASSANATRVVEVRRRAWLVAVIGASAAAIAALYIARGLDEGGAGTWAVAVLMGLVALAHLAALADARSPLLVADEHGVRMRLGRAWAGLRWGSLRAVDVAPRSGLRDGRLVLVPRSRERVESEIGRRGRRSLAVTSRLYGAPFAVPVSLATRVTGAGDDLVAALRDLAGEHASLVHELDGDLDTEVPGVVETPAEQVASAVAEHRPSETSPSGTRVVGSHRGEVVDAPAMASAGAAQVGKHRWHDPRPVLAHGISMLAARFRPGGGGGADDPDVPGVPLAADEPRPVVASATPSPLRELVHGHRADVRADVRAEIRADLVAGANALKADTHEVGASSRALPEAFVLRRPGTADLDDEEGWSGYGEQVRPIPVPGEALETIVVEDFAIEPADDPVIGPEFAAARTRLGLSVDQLAERTRIRPHVIESIEADDFEPCGGDFYARGHIRTLARILGVDAAPLLASYDERYADAPVDPRRVFEAELAHNGGIRATRGGPNWSVLVAAVMAVVLAWSIARLVMDGPVDLGNTPVLNGSGGPHHQGVPAAPAIPVVISAPSSGARVIVRDGSGKVVFTGDLAFGASKTLSVSPPVRVQATDGSVTVSVDGQDRGRLGKPGTPGSGTFVAR